MTAYQELAFSTVHEIHDLIVSKQLSPVEVTNLFLDRIETMDHKVNSFLTVAFDDARAQAVTAEKAVMSGDDLGPLHGIPISIKDLT